MNNHPISGLKLSAIVAQLGGDLQGQDVVVNKVSTLAEADTSAITFLANPKYRHGLAKTQAAAVIVAPEDVAHAPAHLNLIVSDDPYLYFAKLLALFYPVQKPSVQISPRATIAADAVVGENCVIEDYVVIGSGAKIGAGSWIGAGCIIGENCVIDNDCRLYPRVTLYEGTTLGARVIIHSGAVIGADGFGFAFDKEKRHWQKILQVGKVVIENDVEIGANTTIDRAALTATVIGEGSKIDNQVQIGHNCRIGKHCVIAGCVGIAGSTTIGDYCTIGGAAILAGHIHVVSGCVIGGGTGVSRSLDKADYYSSYYPLQTHKEWLKNAAFVRRLRELYQRLKTLEKQQNI